MKHEKMRQTSSVYNMVDTVLGAWNEPLNQMAKDPCPCEAFILII